MGLADKSRNFQDFRGIVCRMPCKIFIKRCPMFQFSSLAVPCRFCFSIYCLMLNLTDDVRIPGECPRLSAFLKNFCNSWSVVMISGENFWHEGVHSEACWCCIKLLECFWKIIYLFLERPLQVDVRCHFENQDGGFRILKNHWHLCNMGNFRTWNRLD